MGMAVLLPHPHVNRHIIREYAIETDAKKSRLAFLAAVTTKLVESYFDIL